MDICLVKIELRYQFGFYLPLLLSDLSLDPELVPPLSSCIFLSCFLCFIRRFWNHVFTCVSLRLKADASSTLSGVERYLWAANLFSRPVSWGSLKTVRAFLRRQCFSALRDISLGELPNKAWWNGNPVIYTDKCIQDMLLFLRYSYTDNCVLIHNFKLKLCKRLKYIYFLVIINEM